MSEPITYHTWLDSPVGRLLLAGDEDGLILISFPSGKGAQKPKPGWVEDARPFRQAIKELKEYFAGTRREFTVKLRPRGTGFQLDVWRELLKIPYGETTSYGALAARIGRPNASRAVGAANGANPLPIIVPCHRVIGANRSLTGFGGGIETKRYLLGLESGEPELFG